MDVITNNLLFISYMFFLVFVILYSAYAFNKPPYEYNFSPSLVKDGSGNNKTDESLEPSLPKYMTEKARYNVFMSFYVMISVGFYTLIGALIDDKVVSLIGLKAGPPATYLLAALIIMGISFAGDKNYEWTKHLLIGNLRKWLHQYAKTPVKGQQLFGILKNARIDYQSSVCQKYIKDLLKRNYSDQDGPRDDLRLDDFKYGGEQTIERMWARLSYCIYLVEEGNRQGLYKSHLNEVSLRWHEIYNDYSEMVPRIIQEKKKKLDDDKQEILSDDLQNLTARTYRMISSLLLIVGDYDADPVKRLEAVGFDARPEKRFFIPSNVFVRIISSVFGAIFSVAILFSYGIKMLDVGFQSIKYTDILIYIASASAILIVPVVFVLGAKKILCPGGEWTIAKDNTYDRPYLLYLMLSFLSWVITVFLMTSLMKLIQLTGSQQVSGDNQLLRMMLYSMLSGLTALFVAYRVDIPSIKFMSRLTYMLWKMKHAIIQGVSTALLTWICLMIDKYGGDLMPTGQLSIDEMGRLFIYVGMAFVTGFVISLSLSLNKHLFERRGSQRAILNKKVSAIINDMNFNVTLKNIAKGGAAFVMDKATKLENGTYVELIFGEGDKRRSGSIVGETDGVLHLRYI